MSAALLLGRAARRIILRADVFPRSGFSTNVSQKWSMGRNIAVLSGASALAIATGLSFNKVQAEPKPIPIMPIENPPEIIKGKDYQMSEVDWEKIEFPNPTVTRQVKGSKVLPGIRLTLFQYQTCPFCCKVRSFLDFMDIPYDIVEVEPVLKQQIKFSKYKKVPILLLREGNNCWQLSESTAIVSILQSFLLDKEAKIEKYLSLYTPIKSRNSDGKEVLEVRNKYNIMFGANAPKTAVVSRELEWRRWADNVLVHVLSPNVYRSREEALQAFNYFSEVGGWEQLFPTWERYLVIYAGAFAMYLVGKRLRKKYNLKEDVRQSFYDECNRWVKHVGDERFAGGKKPDLSDLAVFGVLHSVEGCTAFSDVLEHTKIRRWYEDMKKEIVKT